MLSKINTATIRGIEAVQVTVETDLGRGMPAMNVVGLVDTTIKEAKERIRTAILNSGCQFPSGRLTINMAPADIRKRGSHLDLPMAMGILQGSRQILGADIDEYCFMGELSLDGSVNKVTGVLPMVNAMAKNGVQKFVVPFENREEAALVRGVEIYPASTLTEIITHFNLKKRIDSMEAVAEMSCGAVNESSGPDFADVKGQEYAKRAITVAVAGGHGMVMTGSPSTGKTMLAERIPTIMPDMTYEEILEASIIYSVAGLLDEDRPFISERPFRRPHHKITAAGLIGGGAYPRPGEITLASGGVLFLDEFGEFDRNLIDTLRQPLEEKRICITRLGDTYVYPADFLMVAATNPCKCGYYGDPDHECRCTARDVEMYRSRISGPIMDRIDMHLKLIPVRYRELTGGTVTSSAEMRERVSGARRRQKIRLAGTGLELNSQMNDHTTDALVELDIESRRLLEQAYGTLKLNPRTLLKVKKMSRTIADLDGCDTVGVQHVAEALQYREQGAAE